MEVLREGGFVIPLLYEDNQLLVVEKPPNLPTQADRSGDCDLLCLLKAYIGEKYHKPGAVYLGLVHRLDRPVGGVMVFARTSKAAARLSEAFRSHSQDRRYLAVAEGTIAGPLTLTDWLVKDGRSGMVSVVPEGTPGAKQARLCSRPLTTKQGRTLVEVQLFTGRSHQIRVQHAHCGHPLWGDRRYGRSVPGQQLALWACRLALEHPTRHEQLSFTSRPPRIGIWAQFEAEVDAEVQSWRDE